MAKPSIWQEEFDRDADYIVIKGFRANGHDYIPNSDDLFDKSVCSTRTLRQLVDQKYLSEVVKPQGLDALPPLKTKSAVSPKKKPNKKPPPIKDELVVRPHPESRGKWGVFRVVGRGRSKEYVKASRPFKTRAEAEMFRNANTSN